MLKPILIVLVASFGTVLAQIELEFSTWGEPEDVEIYQQLIKQYNADNEGVTVVLNHIPSSSDYEKNLATLIAARAAPDVFFINNISLPGFAAQNALLSLERYVDDAFLQDFFDGHLDAFRYDGNLLAIPRDISNLVLFYNADLFDMAGVDPPSADWTYDDFLDAARMLTQDTDGDGETDQFGFGYATTWLFWQPWVWSNGGRLFNEDHSEFTLNKGVALEGLQFYVDLRCSENVSPSQEQIAERTASSMFAANDAAMIVDGRWRVAPLNNNESVTFDWDVAPFPKGPAGSVVDIDGSGWSISATSDNPDEAWDFIQFISSPEALERWTEAGIITPSRRSVGETDAFLTPKVAPTNDQVFFDATETAIPTETFDGWGEFTTLLKEGLSEVWLCEISAEEGLADVEDDINELLEDYQ